MKENRKICLNLLSGTVALLALSCAVILLQSNTTDDYQGSSISSNKGRDLLTISTNRLSIVNQYCGSQQIAISDSDRSKNSGYKSAVSSYMTANKTRVVVNMANGNWGEAVRELQTNGIGAFIFVSPFAIGLLLLVLFAPCLLCCCVCQQCCPPKCCRGKNPNYSRDELTWPTTFLLLSTLLLVGAAVPSMTNTRSFFSDFNCQTSKFLDNFMNGGQTANQQYFFSGVTEVQSQLTTVLRPKISDLRTQVARLKPTAGTVMEKSTADISTILTNIKSVPNGVDYAQFSQFYSYPLHQSTATATFASLLGPKVGQFDQSSTLLGDLYQYLSTIQAKLTAIASASSVESQLTDSTANDFGDSIGKADAVLTTVKGNLEAIQSSLESVMGFTHSLDSYIQRYSLVLYGSVLGCAIAVLMGVVFMKCLNVLCCRHLLYSICFLLFFLCTALFLYAIVLSMLMTSMHYTCAYVEDTFTSPNKFTQTLTDIYGSKYSQLTSTFSECFGGTNDFMLNVDVSLKGYLSQLSSSVVDSHRFDFTKQIASIYEKVSSLEQQINTIGLGHIPDFDVTTPNGQQQIVSFNQIASKSFFSSTCSSTSYPVFYQDVWVPGLGAYQNYVSCINKLSIDNSTCGSDITNTAITNCPTSRCIDTFSIISTYYRVNGDITDLLADSISRYGTCNPFQNFLINFYNNYVSLIVQNIGNTVDDAANSVKISGRFVIKAKTPLITYSSYLNTNTKALFTEVYNNLTQTSNLNSIFDPPSGLLTGLDCRVLSENGVSMKQSLCITTYNRVFFTLVTVGILAFGIFLFICCVVCFNVRHYKFSKQIQKKYGKIFPLDETSSQIHLK